MGEKIYRLVKTTIKVPFKILLTPVIVASLALTPLVVLFISDDYEDFKSLMRRNIEEFIKFYKL